MRRLFGVVCIFFLGAGIIPTDCRANLASKMYVDTIVASVAGTKVEQADFDAHVNNKSNPHAVTAAQVGLGNVKNLDQTNASNLASGTVKYNLLPVGTAENTVAAGNDVRFGTIPTVAPSGTPPDGQVYVWFN